MCLATKYDKECKRKTGYKLLSKNISDRFITGQCAVGRVIITKGRYTTDHREAEIRCYRKEDILTYPAGFHIFLNHESAERVQRLERPKLNLILCKVRFKDIVAYGKVAWRFECGTRFRTATVVAKKCMITEVIG